MGTKLEAMEKAIDTLRDANAHVVEFLQHMAVIRRTYRFLPVANEIWEDSIALTADIIQQLGLTAEAVGERNPNASVVCRNASSAVADFVERVVGDYTYRYGATYPMAREIIEAVALMLGAVEAAGKAVDAVFEEKSE